MNTSAEASTNYENHIIQDHNAIKQKSVIKKRKLLPTRESSNHMMMSKEENGESKRRK